MCLYKAPASGPGEKTLLKATSHMPTWIPWIFIGGAIFSALSFIAAKYQGRQHSPKAAAQDFISGGIVIAMLGIIAPDAFPESPISGDIPEMISSVVGGAAADVDLQVGPPPLMRR